MTPFWWVKLKGHHLEVGTLRKLLLSLSVTASSFPLLLLLNAVRMSRATVSSNYNVDTPRERARKSQRGQWWYFEHLN